MPSVTLKSTAATMPMIGTVSGAAPLGANKINAATISSVAINRTGTLSVCYSHPFFLKMPYIVAAVATMSPMDIG